MNCSQCGSFLEPWMTRLRSGKLVFCDEDCVNVFSEVNHVSGTPKVEEGNEKADETGTEPPPWSGFGIGKPRRNGVRKAGTGPS